MKNIIYVLLMIGISLPILSGQLTISPNPQEKGICPGDTVTFTVNGIPSSCSGYIFEKVNGDLNGSLTQSGNTFTINAQNVVQEIEIKFNPGSDPDCRGAQIFKIPVLSVKNKAPLITGCPGALVAGKSFAISLSALLTYGFRGSDDPNEVASYAWSFESGGAGWSISTTNGTNSDNTTILRKFATVVTNNCSEATIKIVATDKCGNLSNPEYCTISRFVEKPSISYNKPYVLCCETDAIAMMGNQSTSGLAGYTYTWSFGSWSGITSGPSAFVTPNGTSQGEITVTANACGKTSTPAKISIPLELIQPDTKVVGDDYLCSNESRTYTLDISPQQCTNTTWSVSPSNAVTISGGVGNTATVTSTGNFSGPGSITFTIETPCGIATRTKNIYIGQPKILITTADGQLGTTYNLLCSDPAMGSHYFKVKLIGDENNCVDKWNDHGTTGTNYSTCDEFDFTWKYTNGQPQCAFVTVSASNRCGEVNQSFIFCPSPYVCDRWKYEFKVSPNPATDQVRIEFYLNKDGDIVDADFNGFEIVDKDGTVVKKIFEKGQNTNIDVSNLNTGQYFIKSFVEGGWAVSSFFVVR